MNDLPIPKIDTFGKLTIPEGTVIHDVTVWPLRIFRCEDVCNLDRQIFFDAIDVETGERLQGYELRRNKHLKSSWRVISNEMVLLALLSMDYKEYRAWYDQNKDTWKTSAST